MQHGQWVVRGWNRAEMGQGQAQLLSKAGDSDQNRNSDPGKTRALPGPAPPRPRGRGVAPPSPRPFPSYGDVTTRRSRLVRRAQVTSRRDAIPPAGPRQDGVARVWRHRAGPVGTAGGDRGIAGQRGRGPQVPG